MNKINRFTIKSTEFANDDFIPPQFTCDGKNSSPPLTWSNAPEGTQSFVLIFDDRTAIPLVGRTVVHWIIINIPSNINELAEEIDISNMPDAEAINNDFCVAGYTGPCAYDSLIHSYRFNLFAMKEKNIDLPLHLTARQFDEFYKERIVGKTRLSCRFIKH